MRTGATGLLCAGLKKITPPMQFCHLHTLPVNPLMPPLLLSFQDSQLNVYQRHILRIKPRCCQTDQSPGNPY